MDMRRSGSYCSQHERAPSSSFQAASGNLCVLWSLPRSLVRLNVFLNLGRNSASSGNGLQVLVEETQGHRRALTGVCLEPCLLSFDCLQSLPGNSNSAILATSGFVSDLKTMTCANMGRVQIKTKVPCQPLVRVGAGSAVSAGFRAASSSRLRNSGLKKFLSLSLLDLVTQAPSGKGKGMRDKSALSMPDSLTKPLVKNQRLQAIVARGLRILCILPAKMPCGCCPKFLVPEIANFTRKKILSRNFRGTIAVHDSENRLL